MEIVLVATIRDAETFVACQRVRIDDLRRSNRVFPLLLHLGVHDEERVVGQVDCDLALFVRHAFSRVGLGEDAADAEFLDCIVVSIRPTFGTAVPVMSSGL